MLVRMIALAVSFAALGAHAATEQLSITGYNVVTKLGEKVTLPNGSVINVGVEGHASLVNDKTGEQTSQYCSYDEWVDGKGSVVSSTGHCAVFYDSGDALWIGLAGAAPDQPLTWTVLGGTGKYAGASGGGTSKLVSTRGDGYAGAYKATGTLTTK
jgi:hypothetical protein